MPMTKNNENQNRSTEIPRIHSKFKDALFRRIFSAEEFRQDLLDLCNALNGTEYTSPEEIRLNTLDSAVYVGLRNDVSCMISMEMTLFEHQSTWSNNMALRECIYGIHLFEKYISEIGSHALYRKKRITLPIPQCYVLYNGDSKDFGQNRTTLRLSDHFSKKTVEYEWTVTVININPGYNQELMAACSLLHEYSEFVDLTRKFIAQTNLEDGVNRAVEEFIARDNRLGRYLSRDKEGVKMLLSEFDLTEFGLIQREEGKEEGEERLIQLASSMKAAGESEADIVKMMTDRSFRTEMIEKYRV